ncbi:polyisoprenoid-binding protein [Ahniella affigens]|uniref:Polyisoprenoid-binding protein n=1 Tax=Ahniella affigens TaxID=2021234 RepID=A0A2P1PVW9_9GAMM|nr:YceI family protein [Ahniella affigens]AVP98972.1 polyisoprenoid-binding protein [Ahniella affigens]
MRGLASMLLLLTSSIVMATDEFRLDPVHTQLQFQVSHLGFSMSEGEFHGFDGSFEFDPDRPEDAACQISIDVASIDMDDAKWNQTMLGKDWFNVAEHPRIEFRCLGLDLPAGSTSGQLRGTLTVLGQSQPVVLDLQFNRLATHKYSQAFVAGFSAKTKIKRSDFGMTRLIPDIGDDVQISLEVEGIRKAKLRGPKK